MVNIRHDLDPEWHPERHPKRKIHFFLGLTEIPLEAIENGKEAGVNALDASKNLLTTFPEVKKYNILKYIRG